MSNMEDFLTALLNDELADIEAKTRVEKYLKACCEKCGCTGLPTPKTRIDSLLYALAEKLKETVDVEEALDDLIGGDDE